MASLGKPNWNSRSPQGKIIEEELFDEGAHNEEEEEDLMMVSDDGAAEDDDAKLFLVRTEGDTVDFRRS